MKTVIGLLLYVLVSRGELHVDGLDAA